MRISLRTLLMTSAILVGNCTLADEKPIVSERTWRTLPLIHDGQVGPDWKHLWGGGFTVMEDGSLRTDCTDAGMGLLLYTKERFGNCQIRPLGSLEETPKGTNDSGPFDGTTFRGRIAYSADGNFNDPDDWAASPVALAIFAEAGVKDRLVHFDYNCIMTRNDPQWQKIHAESVLGAVKHYGYDASVFHDCQVDVDRAVASIARAINASSADNPLYFIVAGPMEVPFLGIQKSDPQKRKFVHCISHSRWNDGFASALPGDFFRYNKRSVIESGVNWVQIQDQNRLLSFSRYGSPAKPEEFRPYFWMRDSQDPNVRFLWERMLISTRPDPSDAGMAWFLVTGDEEGIPDKLQRLLDGKTVPKLVGARAGVRIEAENFQVLEGCKPEDRNDRSASHRLNVARSGDNASYRIRTHFHQPYVAARGRYDADVRCLDEPGERSRFKLFLNGVPLGEAFEIPGDGQGWTSHTIRDVTIQLGDEITVDVNGPGRIDYVQLKKRAAE